LSRREPKRVGGNNWKNKKHGPHSPYYVNLNIIRVRLNDGLKPFRTNG